MRRLLALLASTAVVATTLAVAGSTGAAETNTSRHDVLLVVDSTGLSEADWLVQKRAYLAMLDDTLTFPLDGSISIAFIQYGATKAGGQASRVTLPLTRLDSISARGAITAAINEATLLAPDKPGVDGFSAAAQELSERGTKGAGASICATANAPWESATLTKGVSETKNAGATRLSMLTLSTSSLRPALADQTFGGIVLGDGSVMSARNMPQFGGLITSSCMLPGLRLEAIEVNQVIQDWNNTRPLAEYKDTVVRVFVETLLLPAGAQVSGLLHGTRDGVALSGSPLSPFNIDGDAPVDSDVANATDRAGLSRSLNFRLPTSWLSGDVELTFEAPTTIDCSTAPLGVRDCAVDVSFTEAADIPVDFVSIPYEVAGVVNEPSSAELVEQMYRAEDIFPVQHVDFDFDWLPWTYESKPTEESVNAVLELYSMLEDGCVLGSCDQYYYGVIKGSGGGLANDIPGTAASGFLGSDSALSAMGYARNRGPHEIAHMVGAHHIVNQAQNGPSSSSSSYKNGWCTEVGGSDAPDYPHWENLGGDRPTLGPLGAQDSEIWGLSPRAIGNTDLEVVDPYNVSPLMSYCAARDSTSHWRWPSKQTYTVLTDALMDPGYSGPASARTARSAEYILIRGQVNEGTRPIARFLPISSGAFEPVADKGSGAWSIRLLDRAGKPLATRAFEMVESHGDATQPRGGEPSAVLTFAVPFSSALAPRIGRVQLLEGQRVVATRRASTAAPRVSISSPKAGTRLGGETVTITWSATDQDSRQLTASVFYRTGSDAYWTPVVLDSRMSSVTLPRAALAGSSTGGFKVVVTDGLRSASATTGIVSVANNAPLLELQQAEGNVVGDQNAVLEAIGWDSEDGVLDQQIIWRSNLDGVIGMGRTLDIRASDLSEGVHTITVVATDSGKLSATSTYRLTVARVFEAVATK